MKICTQCGNQTHDADAFCVKCGNSTFQFQSQEEVVNPSNNDKETDKSKKNIINKPNKAYICSIIIGIILVLVGLLIQIPGGALTTYESLDGSKTEYYVFDDKYSSIDEYVGGDAYNYIIGASLVAGKISGTMTTKAIFIACGILCICLGITLLSLTKKENN